MNQLKKKNIKIEFINRHTDVQRLNHYITDNELSRINRIADNVQYNKGRCNLREYVRINDCFDIIEVIETSPMRRLYKNHGAVKGRITGLSLCDFRDTLFIDEIPNVNKGLTACLVLQGNGILEYENNGLFIPKSIQEGNLFLWDSLVKVGFDDLVNARMAIYGVK